MRIAVVADIHGNLPALEAVVADVARRGVDAVVNLGDSLSGPLLPLKTAQFLMAQDWLHIAGNHERQLLTGGPGRWNKSDAFTHPRLTASELAWLASMRPTACLEDDVFLCHGTPTSDVDYFLDVVEPTHVRIATVNEVDARLGDVGASLVLCGHTHVPRAVRSSKGQLVVNPGSVGLPAFDDGRPYPHVMETGSPDARYALVERSGRAWGTSLIAVPYDHMSMAKLAGAHGRADWARALATGFVL